MSAPADEVWALLTEPEAISRWHLCNVLTFEPRPGGSVRFGSGQETVIEGTITELEPGRLLAYTFRFTSEPDDPATVVSFSVEPFNMGSRLTIAHTGFPGYNATFRDVCACWPMLMCGLQDMLKARKRARTSRAA